MAHPDKDVEVVQVRYFARTTVRNDKAQTTQLKPIEYSGVKKNPGQDEAPFIPSNCTAFKFEATFEDQKAGQYCIAWKLKLPPWFRAPWGFHVQAIISYENESTDSSGSLNVVIPKAKLETLKWNEWQEVVVQKHLVIRPHHGIATVKLFLRNNEDPKNNENHGKGDMKYDEEKCGSFFVSNVAIHLFQGLDLNLKDIDHASKSLVASRNINRHDNIPISRISAAPNVNLIATLRVANDKIYVDIWDYSNIQEIPRDTEHLLVDWEPKGETTLEIQSEIHGLPLGISLSPDGQQLAVFQEPKIGDWGDGTKVEKGVFKFQLIIVDNLVPKSGSGKSEISVDCVVTFDNLTPVPSVSNPASIIPSLRSFVGFAKFLPLRRVPSTVNSEHSATPKGSGKNGDTNNYQSLFAACNGIYLDIFDCSLVEWCHLHSITLTDLSLALPRRITCQMMVESMGSNIFLWLEAQGETCSTWSIENGANVSRLSNEDNVSFADHVYRSNLKMAISPDESIIALAGVDGSVRTFFAKSGIEIDTIRFNKSKVEYVGFLGQNDRILVTTRHEFNRKSKAWVCNPMDLKIRTKANAVPIPTAGSTLLLSHTSEHDSKTMVCATEGAVLQFYRVQEKPVNAMVEHRKGYASKSLRQIEVIVDSDYKEDFDTESEDTKALIYKLILFAERGPMEGVGGKDYWILRVSVLQKTKNSEFDNKVIFNFVPEPWLRCPTSEYVPKDLLTVYFLPCKKRFVIIGFQSIQIWSLPSKKHPMVRLLAFWSKPYDFRSLLENPLSCSELYGKFRTIHNASVFDTNQDLTELDVQLLDGSMENVNVTLPGQSRSNHGLLPCYHSIHLLAAAFSFASDSDGFETHAKALVQFAVQYLNRITPLKDILPKKWEGEENPEKSTSNDPGLNKEEEPGIKVPKIDELEEVGILRLLLNNPSFQNTSNPFLKALLSTGNWIPRDDLIPREEKILDPIERAMTVGNHEIVQALVNSCIDNARKRHPAYLTLAIKHLHELKENYPILTDKMFSEASYIKVKNKSYVSANAIVAKPPYQVWKFNNPPWNEYTNPVFRLRTQLPFKAIPSEMLFGLSLKLMQHKRIKAFPEPQNGPKSASRIGFKKKEHNYEIYVAPFSTLSTCSKSGKKNRSKFTIISGTKLLGNPAMVATLRFKWYTYGMVRWALRFLLVLSFSVLFIIITIAQIRANTGVAKYLSGWDTFIYVVIGLGGTCLLYEVWQFCLDMKRYIFSPYNYLSLFSFCAPIIGCIQFLIASEGPHNTQGPSQIWWISFAILAVYINILFELKVLQPLGAAVHSILRIASKIVWFAAVFGLSLIAFTHAFLHILHTRKDSCVTLTGTDQTTCETAETKYPQDPFQALLSTFFFVAGIYDPLSNDLNSANANYSFKILLVIYISFTVILLMNLLIAVMNDGFGESRDEGELTWLRQWSDVIVDVELFMMSQSQRENRDFFPDYIYYGASQRDVEDHERKESAKRLSEGPTDDRLSTNVVKENMHQKNIVTVRQDVKYVLRNQLRIENLMNRQRPKAETSSGHSNQDFTSEAASSQVKVGSNHSIGNDVEPRGDFSLGRVIHGLKDATHGLHQTHDKDKKTSPTSANDEAHGDEVSATSKTLYLYYDDDIYGAVLIENETGDKYLMKLLYRTETKTYYVYYHHDRIDHKLDGPYRTVEDAKKAFQDSYKEKFGAEWTDRKKAVYGRWKYDHESFKTIEEAGEAGATASETEIKELGESTQKGTKTSSATADKVAVVGNATKEDPMKPETGAATVSSGTGIANVLKRAAKGAVTALTPHKAHTDKGTEATSTTAANTKADSEVKGDAAQDISPIAKSSVDELCPIFKTSHVCCDSGDEYSAVLTEKTSDITCVIQLLCSDEAFYVYYRQGKTDCHFNGSYKDIETAKAAFKDIFKKKFDIEWSKRDTADSERWRYGAKVHDTIIRVPGREEDPTFKYKSGYVAVVGDEEDTYTKEDYVDLPAGSSAGGPPTEQRSDDPSAFNFRRHDTESGYTYEN
ncbi:hypothetical protein BGX26_007376 [Mortierella sp. AD094]|nr:hypothetical protein BGX26_007376 [Mortierella sp. AD094]